YFSLIDSSNSSLTAYIIILSLHDALPILHQYALRMPLPFQTPLLPRDSAIRQLKSSDLVVLVPSQYQHAEIQWLVKPLLLLGDLYHESVYTPLLNHPLHRQSPIDSQQRIEVI